MEQLNDINVGLGVTGSFCNFSKLDDVISQIKESGVNKVLPIVSFAVLSDANRFSTPKEIRRRLVDLTGNELVDTIAKAEPIGPKKLIDLLVIFPCTGNTLAKLAHGITDTPVLMAAKSHLRQNRPVVVGLSTNDGLGANAENIGKLLNTKNIYFVPFGQDDEIKKPKSLVCDYTKIVETMCFAMQDKQVQPILTKN